MFLNLIEFSFIMHLIKDYIDNRFLWVSWALQFLLLVIFIPSIVLFGYVLDILMKLSEKLVDLYYNGIFPSEKLETNYKK